MVHICGMNLSDVRDGKALKQRATNARLALVSLSPSKHAHSWRLAGSPHFALAGMLYWVLLIALRVKREREDLPAPLNWKA